VDHLKGEGEPQENREVGNPNLHRIYEDRQQCCGVAKILYVGCWIQHNLMPFRIRHSFLMWIWICLVIIKKTNFKEFVKNIKFSLTVGEEPYVSV
jgi:hypothetical protein